MKTKIIIDAPPTRRKINHEDYAKTMLHLLWNANSQTCRDHSLIETTSHEVEYFQYPEVVPRNLDQFDEFHNGSPTALPIGVYTFWVDHRASSFPALASWCVEHELRLEVIDLIPSEVEFMEDEEETIAAFKSVDDKQIDLPDHPGHEPQGEYNH